MSGATKLMTAGGGGVSLTPASSIASDVTVNLPVTGVSGGTLVCSDSSGNVGIGTTTSLSRLTALGSSSTVANGASTRNPIASIRGGNDNNRLDVYVDNSGGTAIMGLGAYNTAGAGTALAFYTGASVDERMRINSNGNMLIGCTTEAANETHIVLSTNSGTTRWSVGPWSSVSNNFYITATSATQGVYLSGTTATSWSALSDERWKTELQPIENAAEKVSTLRAVTGVYTNDADKKRKSFLIAQDVLEVLPEAVDTENPDKYGLSYTDVIPLLVAAIKELSAKNDALEARITALEAK